MAPDDRPLQINISAIRVGGIGGLGMVAIAAVVAAVLPQAWWLVAFGAIGGVVMGAVLVVVRRVRAPSGPGGGDPHVLFRAEPAETAAPVATDRGATDVRRLAAIR